MRNFIHGAAIAALIASGGSVAFAAKSSAPGQDRVCLVTSKNPNNFDDVDVASTKWLPRKAADKQASKDPSTLKVFDYNDDPLVADGTYASAEDLCNRHFN